MHDSLDLMLGDPRFPTAADADRSHRVEAIGEDRARHFNSVGRLILSVVAMRVFAMPLPAINKALARVTTRYGAVALCAHFVRVFRSP